MALIEKIGPEWYDGCLLEEGQEPFYSCLGRDCCIVEWEPEHPVFVCQERDERMGTDAVTPGWCPLLRNSQNVEVTKREEAN